MKKYTKSKMAKTVKKPVGAAGMARKNILAKLFKGKNPGY